MDTNALLLPFRSRFPLIAEIERLTAPAQIAVSTGVLAELDRLAARRVAFAVAARAWADRFPTMRTARRGDFGLLELAVRRRASVVTSDRVLRRRLLLAGVPVLSPRGEGRLVETPPGRTVSTEGRPRRATVKNGPPLAGRSLREDPDAAR